MASKPILFPPAPFDLADAVTCSDLVDMCYDMYARWAAQGKPRHAGAFEWTPPADSPFRFGTPMWGSSKVLMFRDMEPFALVAQHNDDAYAIFRGTESTEDWYQDAECDQVAYRLPEVGEVGLVHKGFFDLYTSLRSVLIDQLNGLGGVRRLLVTGHSLGAALAMASMPDLMANALRHQAQSVLHYNLAGPRTGDSRFATCLNDGPAHIYRVVNSCDPVSNVPPSVFKDLTRDLVYQHVGHPITYTAQYDSIAGNHAHHTSYNFALKHPDQPQGPKPG